jgi:hypothetical protein
MILNLTTEELRHVANGTLPGTVICKAVRLQAAALAYAERQIEGQMDIDAVLAEMHAPGKEESDAAYERR